MVGIRTVLSPIEIGMGIEDLQTAHQEEAEAQDIEPVGQPHGNRMPVEQDFPGPCRFMISYARHDAILGCRAMDPVPSRQ
ncbi:MAG: hypothetical protein M3036_14305 [Bifidobacteriales bacterium]|nr:hypothetical protein [Bifidobacteriales bacterium]